VNTRIVGDEEFDLAWKDINNIRIINKVCSRYFKIIPGDELHRCKLVALWEALKAYDPEKGQKFTSFLYNRIDWECKKQLYDINKRKRQKKYNEALHFANDQSDLEIEDVIQKLHPSLREVIYQRFFERLTMEEIAERNDYSRETARRYILRALEKLKDIY
jgi:RNA polymerase sigma factor (sigma-70 family)